MALLAVFVPCCSSDGGGEAKSTTTVAASKTTMLSPSTTTTTMADDGGPSSGTGTDWCPPIDAVIEVAGHDLDQSMSAGGSGSSGFSYAFEGCSYKGDDNSYGITRATVENDEGRSPFDLFAEAAQEDLAESGFTPVEGLGDDAYLAGQALAIRLGSVIVFLEVDDPDREDTADLRDALAADLTDLDLSDQDTLCTVPAAAVQDVVGPVADARNGGGAMGIGDVQFETDSCMFDLDDGAQVTISTTDASSWDAWVEAKQSSGFTASYEASTLGEHAAFDNGKELFVDDGDHPLRVTASGSTLSAEDSSALRAALAQLVLDG